MSTVTATSANVPITAAPSSLPGLVRELRRRQPRLAAAAEIFLVAAIPLCLAILFDDRRINGISVWIKPVKFLVSLGIYFATLAWFHGYLPARVRGTRLERALVGVPIAIGLLEMAWLVATAALGVPSHFNRSAPIFELSYALAGLGATVLMVVVLTTGVVIGRSKTPALPPAYRLSIVLGSALAFIATMVTAGFLAAGTGHWVGGTPSDAAGLPLVGWSRTGGDLRVAHFFAMHALQVVPLLGWAVARSGIGKPRTAVWAVAAVYAGWIVFTFVQALHAHPLL